MLDQYKKRLQAIDAKRGITPLARMIRDGQRTLGLAQFHWDAYRHYANVQATLPVDTPASVRRTVEFNMTLRKGAFAVTLKEPKRRNT